MGRSTCGLQGTLLSRWSASTDFCEVANFLAVEAGLVVSWTLFSASWVGRGTTPLTCGSMLGSSFSGLVISGVLLLIQCCGHEGGLIAF